MNGSYLLSAVFAVGQWRYSGRVSTLTDHSVLIYDIGILDMLCRVSDRCRVCIGV